MRKLEGDKTDKTKRTKKKIARSIARSINTTKDDLSSKKSKKKKPKMTKVECKVYYGECKRTLRKSWASANEESSEDEAKMEIPSNFKSYMIQDRKIVL